MEFLDTLDELSIAIEAVSKETRREFKKVQQAAVLHTKQIKRLAKAHKYEECIVECKAAIAEISKFKDSLDKDFIGGAGMENNEGKFTDALVKDICVAVLGAVTAAASVFLYKKFGKKMSRKIANNDKLASAQSIVSNTRIATATRRKYNDRLTNQYTTLEKKADRALDDRNYDRAIKYKSDAYNTGLKLDYDTNRTYTADEFKDRNTGKINTFHNADTKDTAKMVGKVALISGSVTGLIKVIKDYLSSRGNTAMMHAALESSIVLLTSIQNTCQEALDTASTDEEAEKYFKAKESLECIYAFYDAVLEEVFNDENYFILDDFRDLGFDELSAVELYLDIAPIMEWAIESVYEYNDVY